MLKICESFTLMFSFFVMFRNLLNLKTVYNIKSPTFCGLLFILHLNLDSTWDFFFNYFLVALGLHCCAPAFSSCG